MRNTICQPFYVGRCGLRLLLLFFLMVYCESETAAQQQSQREWERRSVLGMVDTHNNVHSSVPEDGSPARTLYDALLLIHKGDDKDLSELLARDAQRQSRAFVNHWKQRVVDWQINFRRCAVIESLGWAYVALVSEKRLPTQGVAFPFVEVVFLRREPLEGGPWRITNLTLDAEEKRRVEQMLREIIYGRSVEQVEAELDESRRQWQKMTAFPPPGVSRDEWDIDAAYEKQRSLRAERNRRCAEGSMPQSFTQMMEMYKGEYLIPPVVFNITDEPANPGFNNLLDAVQTMFYLRTLHHSRYAEAWGWRSTSIDDPRIAGIVPEYLPYVYNIMSNVRISRLSSIQLFCRVPLRHKGQKYQIVHYRFVKETNPLVDKIAMPIKLDVDFIGFGYMVFRKVGRQWIPSRNIGDYVGFDDVYSASADCILGRMNSTRTASVDDALERLIKYGLPEHMMKLYSKEECRSIDDARRDGLWRDL